MRRSVVTLAALLAVGLPALAAADPTPAPVSTPIPLPSLPSTSGIDPNLIKIGSGLLQQILTKQAQVSRDTAHGNVSYFHRYDMQVVVGRNTYRDVHLHQGTVIDPRGATIREGNVVDVQGHGNSDGSLNADRITIVSQ